jgi:hypothetical protein
MNPEIVVVLLLSNLVIIMKSSHRHPINRMLHIVGLVLYASGFYLLFDHITAHQDLNLVYSLVIWFTAIDLFIVGHVIEGNVEAMTIIILFKYVRFKLSTKKSRRSISCGN